MSRRAAVLALVLFFPLAAGAEDAAPIPPGGPIPPSPAIPAQPAPDSLQSPAAGSDLSLDMAVLGALDKVTARVQTIEAPVGKPVRFGTLEIIARACKKHRPEESPESAAFLDIWDLKPGLPAQSLFRGWMFSSSPAVSAMEHPIYDIWVLDCRKQ